MTVVHNIVLVHGAFVDGSGWQRVYQLLLHVLDLQDGPAVLVGHSYGGAVITESGVHDNVAALVYIAAFAPDEGESAGSISAQPVPGADPPPILPPENGSLALDRERFASAFAADVEPAQAAFMADSQVRWGLDAVNGAVSNASWRSKPSWYLVASEDRMIPPQAQRAMAERASAMFKEIGLLG